MADIRGTFVIGGAIDAQDTDNTHEISNITSPTAHIKPGKHHTVCHTLALGVIGNIDGAKQVAEVYLVSIGQCKLTQMLEIRGVSAVGLVLCCHIRGKVGVLGTSHKSPCTRAKALHARANKADNQPVCIATICRGIVGCIALEHIQVRNEGCIVGHEGRFVLLLPTICGIIFGLGLLVICRS